MVTLQPPATLSLLFHVKYYLIWFLYQPLSVPDKDKKIREWMVGWFVDIFFLRSTLILGANNDGQGQMFS